MSTNTGSYEIHSAARGPHWIAWLSRAGSQQPEWSVVLVGKTQEQAEDRARAWATSIYNLQLEMRN